MAKRMLIDATHQEETRVIVLNENRLEEFDFESANKKQIKGNIYLARVMRVEPSLQACFVEYGGNRHGFLSFSEIHPDYYRIPQSDREQLLSMAQAEEQSQEDESLNDEETPETEPTEQVEPPELATLSDNSAALDGKGAQRNPLHADDAPSLLNFASPGPRQISDDSHKTRAQSDYVRLDDDDDADGVAHIRAPSDQSSESTDTPFENVATVSAEPVLVGGDTADSEVEQAATALKPRPRFLRHYKIQDVIVRRQVLLIQVVKEERGSKGAALTTYLSLAGRYCVLMPNAPRGGGVSRKITSMADRKRLKAMVDELNLPDAMGVIVRTAGMERPKPEIRRDLDYLLRLWNTIRDTTLQSNAPCLIHEEGDLIKRSIRDLYSRDIDEILVAGEDGYRTAKSFMQLILPNHSKRVQPYRDDTIPIMQRYQVEVQLDAIHSPIVQLKSGGYIVINPTEALVAIDVNSGRATREKGIEETAIKTNIEAVDEVARQIRLRDLSGLIVIDFIDMEETRNIHAVERRIREAMKNDRARIQIGSISMFGLLELSRQRLRSSLLESSSEPCPHCQGTGRLRSIESTALHVLRGLEEEGMAHQASALALYLPTDIAFFILNHKRQALTLIEQRYGFTVELIRDDSLYPPAYRLERRELLPKATHRTASRFGEVDARAGANLAVSPDESDADLESDAPDASSLGDSEMSEPSRSHTHRAERGSPSRDENASGDGNAHRRQRPRQRRGGQAGRHPSSAPAITDPTYVERAASHSSENRPSASQLSGLARHENIAAGGTTEPGLAEGGDQAATSQDQAERRRRGRRGGRRRGRREFAGAAPDHHPNAAAANVTPHASGERGGQGEYRDHPSSAANATSHSKSSEGSRNFDASSGGDSNKVNGGGGETAPKPTIKRRLFGLLGR
ncbi:MAG: ribonuclease E/G [Alphaproteobacteria bacterium]|nr:ribonuclease E/G [Alphaproteobacteria bacterium]